MEIRKIIRIGHVAGIRAEKCITYENSVPRSQNVFPVSCNKSYYVYIYIYIFIYLFIYLFTYYVYIYYAYIYIYINRSLAVGYRAWTGLIWLRIGTHGGLL